MSRIPDYMLPVDMAMADATARLSPRERLIAEHDDYDNDRRRWLERRRPITATKGELTMYIIRDPERRIERSFVQESGSPASYGPLRTAKRFSTREQAQCDACENETIETEEQASRA